MKFQKQLERVSQHNEIIVLQSESDPFKRRVASLLNLPEYADTVATYSQSCTFHHDHSGNTVAVTSGHLVGTILSEEAKRNLEVNNVLSLHQLQDLQQQVWVHLLLVDSEGKDEYVPLQIVGLAQVASIGQLDPLLTTIIFCHCKRADSFKAVSYSDAMYQGQRLYTISSPFGMLSSELYKNSLRVAIVSRFFTSDRSLVLLDMITNAGQEGGGVYDETLQFVGMLLPRCQLGKHNNVYYGLAVTWYTIYNLYQRTTMASIGGKPLTNIVTPQTSGPTCLIIANSFASGTLLFASGNVFVLTVRHVLSKTLDEPIIVLLHDVGKFKAVVAHFNESNVDFIILKLISPNEGVIDRSIQLEQFIEEARLVAPNQGDQVYTCGYGLLPLNDHREPLIAYGTITKLVYDRQELLLIETDCYMHNGYSGGGVFNANGQLIAFQSFNLQSPQLGILCDYNFAYPLTLIMPALRWAISGNEEDAEDVFVRQNEFLRSLQSLQTRFHVPYLKPKL